MKILYRHFIILLALMATLLCSLRLNAQYYFSIYQGDIEMTPNKVTGYRWTGTKWQKETNFTAASNYTYEIGMWTSSENPTTTASNPGTVTTVNGGTVNIVDQTDVSTVLSNWDTRATNQGRRSSSKTITITCNVQYQIQLNNVWLTANNCIQFQPHKEGAVLEIYLKGDNRLHNFYYHSYTKKLDSDPNGYSTQCFNAQIQFYDQDKNTGTSKKGTLTLGGTTDNGNHYNSVIGGTDTWDEVRGIHIYGGTIFAGAKLIDNCTAIGAGGNGYGSVYIHDGTVTAVCSSTGCAIGGGIGWSSAGGEGYVEISGGTVYAYNHGYGEGTGVYKFIPATAIGGASSGQSAGNKGTVKISGGTVYAQSTGGTAIGGGGSADAGGGAADVTISGSANVTAKSVSGTVNSQSVSSGTSIGGGTGKTAGGNVTFNMTAGTLKSGSVGGGKKTSASNAYGSGTVTISGGTINAQFVLSKPASGSSTFSMTGGTIGGKLSGFTYMQPDGYALWMETGTATINGANAKITGCTGAGNGGAVYMTTGSTFTLTNGTIEKCSATNGGAVYMGGGTFNMNGGTIGGSSLTYANTAANYGGALYMAGGTFKMIGGSINYNKATNNDGGGVYIASGGTATINGGTLQGNQALNGNGGGLYVNPGGSNTTTINSNNANTTISSNKAKNGGGVYVASGTLNVSSTNSKTTKMESNEASIDGGGAYVYGGAVTLTSVTLGSNKAAGSTNGGGGIFANANVTVNQGSLTSNEATAGNGGGIYATAGTIEIKGGANLTSNKATSGLGGGIYAGGTSTVTVTNGTHSSNQAGSGGFVYAAGGSVTLTTATLSSNSATSGNGGGIYGGGGNITVNAGSIASNTANSGNGGGVYATSGTITFNSTSKAIPTFTGNSAVNGGVLYMEGGTCNINAGTLGGTHANRNKATNSGGAIYADNGIVNFDNGTISYNTAATSGGGLYVATNGTLNMTGNVTLDYNHVPATKHGGGVYLAGVLKIGSTTARTVSAQYNFADGTVDTDPSSVTISSTNRNNVYLPVPQVNTNHTDVITVVKNGLTTSTRVGFSVPSNFVPVIYCDEASPYTYLTSFLTPIANGGMKETVFDDAEKYSTVHYPNSSFYDPKHIYLSGGTWVDHVNGLAAAPAGFSVSGNNVTISSSDGLAWLIKYINGISPVTTSPNTGVTVTLNADIDMGDYAWVPMGSDAYSGTGTVFTGTFDGNGHTISNIKCQWLGNQTGENLGLFGTVGSNATVKNVFLEEAELSTVAMTTSDGTPILGGVTGQMSGGTVYNCGVDAVIETQNANAIMGGLVGQQSGGEVHSSYAVASLKGYTMGGLVGTLTSGNLYNSFANPQFTVKGGTPIVGGLVAENSGTIQNCYVRLSRTQSLGSAHFGMLAGVNSITDGGNTVVGSISQCYGPDGASAQFNHSYTYLYNGVTTGLSNCDLYKKTDAPYLYNRPNDNLVGSTGKTLTEKLNEWVSGKGNNSDYAFWKRTTAGGYTTSAHAGNINDDYPIHKMKGLSCVGSPDGLFMEYKYSLNELIRKYNGLDENVTLWLYDSPLSAMTVGSASPSYEYVSQQNTAKVKLYIDEDASLLQATNNVLYAFTSQTLGDYTTRGERWHYASSSLKQSDIGFSYASDNEPFSWAPNPCGVSFSTTNDNALFPGDLTSSDITKIDLYAFYEPEYHWVNLKRNTNSHWHMNAHEIPIYYNGNGTGGNGNETYLIPGKGYLMSIDKEQLLQNWGELNNDNVTLQDVTYTEYNAWAGLLGYNVLGNPYQSYLDFSLFINDSGNASLSASKAAGEVTYATYDPRYDAYVQYKAGSSKGSRSADEYIHPHQGFLIRRSGGAASTTATFTNDMRSNDGTSQFRQSEQPAFPLINLMLTDGSGNSDLAVLELGREHNEGVDKLRVGDCGARISLALGQDEYAILFRDEVEDYQSLHLAVETAGTYTLYWETANGEFEALTLVDNITGTRTDMLARDSYMFEATPEQYASRFKIVIGDYKDIEEHEASEPAEGSSPFAFINNGNLIVNGEGSLEMIDVLGRTVKTDELHGSQSTVSMPQGAAGVYVLRLTLDGVTKVQKIVIK